jgi:hypothetical protein
VSPAVGSELFPSVAPTATRDVSHPDALPDHRGQSARRPILSPTRRGPGDDLDASGQKGLAHGPATLPEETLDIIPR